MMPIIVTLWTNTPTRRRNPSSPRECYSRLRSGVWGDCHVRISPSSVLLDIRPTDPPRRIPTRLCWLFLTRAPRQQRQVLAPAFTCLVLSDLLLLYWSILSLDSVTLSRCSFTVRTLCYRREMWVCDPPTVEPRNLPATSLPSTTAASNDTPRSSGVVEEQNGSTEPPMAFNPGEPMALIRDRLARIVHRELKRNGERLH